MDFDLNIFGILGIILISAGVGGYLVYRYWISNTSPGCGSLPSTENIEALQERIANLNRVNDEQRRQLERPQMRLVLEDSTHVWCPRCSDMWKFRIRPQDDTVKKMQFQYHCNPCREELGA